MRATQFSFIYSEFIVNMSQGQFKELEPDVTLDASQVTSKAPQHDTADKIHNAFLWVFVPGGFLFGIFVLVLLLLKTVHAEPACLVVAGYCSCLSLVMTLMLVGMHLSTFTNKLEQRMIVRIILMCPIYALDSFIALNYYHLGTVIGIVRDAYEGYVIFQFFRLLLLYCGGDEAVLNYWRESKPEMKHLFPFCWMKPCQLNRLNLDLWKCTVSQYTVINPFLTLITIPLYFLGYYEEGNMNTDSVYLYFAAIRFVSVSFALTSLVYFLIAVEKHIEHHSPEAKFIAVKAVVFATFWQSVLFAGLAHFEVIKPTLMWNKDEIATGLNNFCICIEMFFVSAIHRWVFGDKPYLPTNGKRRRPQLWMIQKLFRVGDVVRALHEDLWGMPSRRWRAWHRGEPYLEGSVHIRDWYLVDDDDFDPEGQLQNVPTVVLTDKTREHLLVLLPAMSELFPGASQVVAERCMVNVMLTVIEKQTHHTKDQCKIDLMNACPSEYPTFASTVQSSPHHDCPVDDEILRLVELWFEVDRDNSGTVSKKEALNLLHQLNYRTTSSSFKRLFSTFDEDQNGTLDFSEFCRLYEHLTCVEEITSDQPLQLDQRECLASGASLRVRQKYLLSPKTNSWKMFLKSEAASSTDDTSVYLKVTIVSGHQLPKPKGCRKGEIIDPFVEVFIGNFTECNPPLSARPQFKTKYVEDDGWHPTWNESITVTVASSETIVLRVWDYDHVGGNNFIGESSAVVRDLREGYRAVELFDKKGLVIQHAVVLVCIEKSLMT